MTRLSSFDLPVPVPPTNIQVLAALLTGEFKITVSAGESSEVEVVAPGERHILIFGVLIELVNGEKISGVACGRTIWRRKNFGESN